MSGTVESSWEYGAEIAVPDGSGIGCGGSFDVIAHAEAEI